jgi:acyl phosphate:glycerol-3-phosphate acyltransferase
MTMELMALLVLAYFLGAVPFGVVVARAHGVDIMAFGSGNIGATNVKRALGWRMGLLVFALDVAKGVLPPILARFVLPPNSNVDPQILYLFAGIAAVLGHCFSPFLKFRGGKGIATTLGAALGAVPVVALLCFAVFLPVLIVTRFMSVASVAAMASAIVWGIVLPDQSPQMLIVYVLLTIFIAARHWRNFGRLLAGTEPKFEWKRSDVDAVQMGERRAGSAADSTADPAEDRAP